MAIAVAVRLPQRGRRYLVSFAEGGVAVAGKFERGDGGAAAFVDAQIIEDFLRCVGTLSEDELEMVTKGGFDGGDVLVGDADFVGERTEDGFGFVERGEGAGAETFAVRFKLPQDVET